MDDQSQSIGMRISDGHPDALSQGGKRKDSEVVSTHVLVPEEQVQKLKELSKRTRIHQSDYLREAVDDLLVKYGKSAEESDK